MQDMTPSLAVAEVGAPRRDPYSDRTSLEFRFRARRFAAIRRIIENVLAERDTVEIVDLGGTETYWLIGEDLLRAHRDRIRITLVNTEPQRLKDGRVFSFFEGTATDPHLLADRQFDLVHSNSVIEHVGDWAQMRLFAENVRRLSSRYYVQTPNFWFAFEPHFRTPAFQYLPEPLRVKLIMSRPLGFFKKIDHLDEAWHIVQHHRLLTTTQMRQLFPDAAVGHEKAFGLNKSIIAVRDA